ncbi:HLA class II histocompatibility antigen, DM beta chain-like isoform X1 [Anas acuta]|uniref:HLA class II histocompatibility antigen, DM beta chain-like isoform X1 n=1 Tax=Anas acuta TaxID=28680 RepID=UPI0035C90914
MLVLLGLALGVQGAGAFLMQMASSCPLAANGSVMGFDFTLSFNKNPLVCYDPDNQRFVACNWGLLQRQAMQLAAHLNNGSTWVQRIEARRQACSDLALRYWDWTALRRTQPQVRIIPAETGNARVPVRLTCHIWGFYPPEVTVIWLHNGDIVEPDDYNPISAIPNGDWTYQTQVSLLVAPVAGDTYTCSVQHISLQEPLLEDWSPGLMPEVTILVVVATVLMVLGLGLFLAGVYRYKARPPAPGYTPLPGDNYPAGNGVPIPVHISEGQISPSLTLCVPPVPRQHLRTPRRTPPGTGGSRLAPSQTQCHGADNKDAPQAPLVSVKSSGHRAEGHALLQCLTKIIGCGGAMAWDPKGPSVPWVASGTALLAG